jgi:hypothetical protein
MVSLSYPFNHDNRAESLPFIQVRNAREITQTPHSAANRAAMREIEGIKEIRLISPAEVIFNLVMKIGGDSPVGFFMITLER